MWVQMISGAGHGGWKVMGEFRIINGELKPLPFPGYETWFKRMMDDRVPDADGRLTIAADDPQGFLEGLPRLLRGWGARALLLDDDEQGHFEQMTQEEVAFEHPAKGKDKCADCIFYTGEDDSCALVEGIVKPDDWCNQFSLTEDEDEPAATDGVAFDAEGNEKGQWVTLNGAHVFIENGKITKGPKDMVGKAPHEVSPHASQKNPEGEIFVSPNKAEKELTFQEAVAGLKTPAHAHLKHMAADIAEKVDHGAEVHDAIGDWSDGAENSLVVIPHTNDINQVRYIAALLGDEADQKAVIPFIPNEGGKDSLWSFKIDADMDTARKQLDDYGLKFRTLQPEDKGVTVWVFDQGHGLENTMEKVGEHYAIEHISGQGEFLGGGESRTQAHKEYGEVIRNYERYNDGYQGRNR